MLDNSSGVADSLSVSSLDQDRERDSPPSHISAFQPGQSENASLPSPKELEDIHLLKHSAISDLELMHHYMQRTVKEFVNSEASIYAWTVGFPTLAFSYEAVSKSVLALAASSLARDTLSSINAMDNGAFYGRDQTTNSLASKGYIAPDAVKIYTRMLLRAGDCLNIAEEYYKDALSALQGELSCSNETSVMSAIIAASCILTPLVLTNPHIRHELATLNGWLHTAACINADIHLQDSKCIHYRIQTMYGLAADRVLNTSWMILTRGISSSVEVYLRQSAPQLNIANLTHDGQNDQTQSDISLPAHSTPLYTSINSTKTVAFTQLRRRLAIPDRSTEQNRGQICLTALDLLEQLVDPILGEDLVKSINVFKTTSSDHEWLIRFSSEAGFYVRHLLEWGPRVSSEYMALLQQQPPHPAALVVYAYFNVFMLLHKHLFWIGHTGHFEVSKIVGILADLEGSPLGLAEGTSSWAPLMEWPQSMTKIAFELEKYDE